MLRVLTGVSFAVLSLSLASGVSFAGDDDDGVDQCIAAYKAEGQTAESAKVFCKCMEDQMPDADEDQPIIEWGKAHPDAATSCGKKAGWTTE